MARLAPLFSLSRKEISECSIIRARRSHRLCDRRHCRRRHVLVVVVVVTTAVTLVTLVFVIVTAIPRYDNFTFIDRCGRTSLYLPFSPLHPFLSLVSLFRALPFPSLSSLGQSFFLAYSFALTRRARSLSVYSARRVREIPGCASSKLKRSCTLGIRGLACTYIIRRKLRRAM